MIVEKLTDANPELMNHYNILFDNQEGQELLFTKTTTTLFLHIYMTI